MKKPEKQTVQHWNYQECEKYIAHKLGIKDLRDVDGRYLGNPDAKYKDFWNCVCEHNEMHNGCYVWIYADDFYPDWAQPIVKAFVEEFGEEEYWVEW